MRPLVLELCVELSLIVWCSWRLLQAVAPARLRAVPLPQQWPIAPIAPPYFANYSALLGGGSYLRNGPESHFQPPMGQICQWYTVIATQQHIDIISL